MNLLWRLSLSIFPFMSAETLLQAVEELDEAEKERFYALLDDLREAEPIDQAEADRIVKIMQNTKRWYTEEEVLHLFKKGQD